MATYNNVKYLSLPQQVEKNRLDIETLANSIVDGAVGPQGATGPRGPQGVIGNTGLQGIQGINGTPVAGISYESSNSSITDTRQQFTIPVAGILTTYAQRFVFKLPFVTSNIPYFILYFDGELQTGQVSTLDFIQLWRSGTTAYIQFYNENGEATTVVAATSVTNIQLVSPIATSSKIYLYEVVDGSTVGPAGAQGATGATGEQGATGPTGAQGIQGLPGLKNMAFLEAYVNEATFTPYAYRVMIQIVGGDYDGLTFIKETLVNESTVKFGPYATLVTIETNGGVIQCILQNGVTSIRIYKIDNID